mmetsp:Transcript_10513/g.11995  ORF Transcript_10513/g.11995 Transcript_10513/m.11995 type:complete len:286 (-) Transcript_10513:556-1413(-)
MCSLRNFCSFLVVVLGVLGYFLQPYLSYGPPLDVVEFKKKYGFGKALVTGAARGIGAEFADQLGGMGIDLILVSRRKETLEPTAEKLRKKHGVEVRTIELSFGHEGDTDELIRAVEGEVISLYVNNHAATNLAFETDLKNRNFWIFEDFELSYQTIYVNYIGALKLCYYFGNKMAEMRKGGIILVSSASALKPMPYLATYASSKAALTSFGNSFSYEMESFHVDVITANVGATDTPALRETTTPETLAIIPYQTTEQVVDETFAKTWLLSILQQWLPEQSYGMGF